MYEVLWNNGAKAEDRERGYKMLEDTLQDLELLYVKDPEDWTEEDKEGAENIGVDTDLEGEELRESVYEAQANYGLSLDIVEPEEGEEGEKYIRYQFSWGGPSDELRIFADRSEYVYLDWFLGIAWDVTNNETIQEVEEFLKEIGYEI